MPSKIEHEILKLRGEISSTGKIYTESVASIKDSLTEAEEDIKDLESNSKNDSTKVNLALSKSQIALIRAKTPLPQRNRVFTVDSRRTTGGSGLQGDHLDKASTEYSSYNFKLPQDFVELVSIHSVVRRANACVSGEVCIELSLLAGSEGQSYNAHNYSDTIFPTIANSYHYKLLFDTSGMSINKNDYITVTIQRVGGNGADTLDEDLILTMLEVEYLADM